MSSSPLPPSACPYTSMNPSSPWMDASTDNDPDAHVDRGDTGGDFGSVAGDFGSVGGDFGEVKFEWGVSVDPKHVFGMATLARISSAPARAYKPTHT